MAGKHRRLIQAGAVLGAAGAGVALTAGAAAADTGAVTVTPHTGLHDAQSVSVFWDTGLPLNTSVVVVQAAECSGPVQAGPSRSPAQCDGKTTVNLHIVLAPDGDLAFEGTLNVQKSIAPPSGNVSCTNQCTIDVAYALYGASEPVFSASVPITFK